MQGLTWIEELLIARVHVCGSIVRLGQRNNPTSFFGLKGHVVFLPQDTTALIDLLPMSPAALSDVVKVVWTGKSKPDRARLRSQFTVRKQNVYDALKWLVENHEDYKAHVTMDEEMMSAWEPTFVAVEMLDNIGHVSDTSTEDASRDGFGMDNPDDDATEEDLPFTSSGIVDMNNIAEVPDHYFNSSGSTQSGRYRKRRHWGRRLESVQLRFVFHLRFSDHLSLWMRQTSRRKKRQQTAVSFEMGYSDVTAFVKVCFSTFSTNL
jgi:uncharacterized protein DUF6570